MVHAFTERQVKDTLEIIEASIVNCEKVQPKLKFIVAMEIVLAYLQKAIEN